MILRRTRSLAGRAGAHLIELKRLFVNDYGDGRL
jgi:hypothetical protein